MGGDRGSSSSVPGLDVVWPAGGLLPASARRTGPNQWLLGLGHPADVLAAWPADEREVVATDPGKVAARGRGGGAGFVARIELDACGAWVTVACTADLRPLVLRRAGWVDERGDAVVPGQRAWPEDRVGLGPGDAVAVVLRSAAAAGGDGGPELDLVATGLLDHLGSAAQVLVDAACGADGAVVAAVAVPSSVAGAGPGWVVEATGVPEAELVLPGYPLGDAEPERWRQPPTPPRRATFRLHRDLTRLHDLRGVVGRLVNSWRLQDRLDDDLLTLLTTELATNALVHTETPATATVTYLGTLVRVQVHDGSPDLPERRDAQDVDLGGRGIALIEELAADWGSVASSAGKRTWFDLPVASLAPSAG